jgi:natural product biosynthesis luciferase-like monooxygenase protein
VQKNTQIETDRVPVGFPVEDTEALLLDESGREGQIWGEIAIKSEYVAHGYWRNESLTNAAFLRNPGGDARVYRTGDLGRRLADGSLIYLGRKDSQVKIRGHRIETAEIEALLMSVSGVKEAVVIAFEISPEDKRLVAYLVSRGTTPPTVHALRARLRSSLPDYMIPAAFLFVDAIPTTSTGKVHRRALPTPDWNQLALRRDFVAPRTTLEKDVARIWSEVLGVEQIGVHDHFFEMGGHSLLAAKLIYRLREAFQVDLPLRRLFEDPTIASVSSAIEEGRRQGAKLRTPDIVPVSRDAQRAKRGHGVQSQSRGASDGKSDARPSGSFPLDRSPDRELQFSLFFFSADGAGEEADKYRLLIESAKYADRHGFAAIWTPERHFHQFGGLYANPAVAGAALAMVTDRIQIRAGSVVLPLQNPLRVAEEWAMVDNLSKGRVGISFASGWHANDFTLAPEIYGRRRQELLERLTVVQRLWRGEAVKLPNGEGNEFDVQVFPRPIQPQLPLWLTCQSDETFVKAAKLGASVLTNLNYKSLGELKQKIDVYRRAWVENGRDPLLASVAVMIHTFIGEDYERVKEQVREAYRKYLFSNISLQQAQGPEIPDFVSDDDKEAIIANAIERLFHSHGLVGDVDACAARVAELRSMGVDEIACLIDFGVEYESVMEGLKYIHKLKQVCAYESIHASA